MNIIKEISHIRSQLDFLVNKFSNKQGEEMVDLTKLIAEVENAVALAKTAGDKLKAFSANVASEAANTANHVANLENSLHNAFSELNNVLTTSANTVEIKTDNLVMNIVHDVENVANNVIHGIEKII